MRSKQLFNVAALFMSLFLGGCVAQFQPGVTSLHSLEGGLPTVKDVREGLEVSLEEYVSANKSRRVFDANLATHGVLPLYLRVENHGARDFRVDRREIRAFVDEDPLLPIYGYQAAKQGAAREYVGKALVNTAMWGPLGMIFGLPTIVSSASHTHEVNRKVEQHFDSLEFTGAELKPGETASGFVYYRLAGSAEKLEGLRVEMTVEGNGSEERGSHKMDYRFVFPSLGFSGLTIQ